MAKGGSSFLTSLPGILTALGTLVAASAGLIALFISANSGPPSPSSSTTPVVSASPLNTSGNTGGGTNGNITGGGGTGSSGGIGGTGSSGGTGGTGSSGGTGGSNGGSGGTTGGSGGTGGSNGGSGGTVISGVRLTGDTAVPTVIISGHGFGTSPPAGQANNSTSCGSYTNNGEDYGPKDLWFEDVSNFAAGNGTPPNGTCIGIIVLSWSSDQLVYQFGNAYNSFDHWYLSAGDQYIVSVKGVQSTGTVSFSS